MRALILALICFSLSCNGLREGAMTIFEVKFINGLTNQPLQGRPIKVQKCLGVLSGNCSTVDTIFTDSEGFISYALFHDGNEDSPEFRLVDGGLNDALCMKESENQYNVGNRISETRVLKPYLPLLNIEIQKNDSDIEWISVSNSHDYPCSPWNRNKTFTLNGMSIDTSYQFEVPPFEQIEVGVVTSRFSTEENTIEQFEIKIEDQQIIFRVD